jgi:hypothetical protein
MPDGGCGGCISDDVPPIAQPGQLQGRSQRSGLRRLSRSISPFSGGFRVKRLVVSLNKLLSLADLELRPRRRSIPALLSHPRLTTAGMIVELIGTQGIGKSTLTNDLHAFMCDRWFFRSDLGQLGPAATISGELEELHRDIYFRRIKRLRKTRADPWSCITVSQQMSKVISESLTILTHDFPRGFFLDENLFKNFPREVLKLDPERATPLWKNRALVHLRARDPDFVVSRYQARVLDRSNRGLLQRPPTEAELRERIARDNDRFDRMMDMARDLGCPALIIHAEDDQRENIRNILEFESNLRATAGPDPRQENLPVIPPQIAAAQIAPTHQDIPEKAAAT